MLRMSPILGLGAAALGLLALSPLGPALISAQASSPPNTAIDRLDAPALLRSEPSKVLLQDVTRAGEALVAVGQGGAVIRSADGGASWTQAPSPVSVDLTGVAARQDGLVIAVGHDGAILRSEDAGATWESVTDGRDLLPRMIAAAEARHEAATTALAGAAEDDRSDLEFALDDELFRLETAHTSMEYGPSWPFLDVVFASDAPDEARVLALGGYGMAFLSEDEGRSWALINDRFENPEDFHFNAGYVSPDGAMIVGSEAGVLHRASADLRRFERIDTFDGFSFFGLGSVAASERPLLVAYGFGDTFHRSFDDGRSWESMRLSEASTFVAAVPLPNGSLGVMGLGGVMVEIGPDGEGELSRPLDNRAALGGAVSLGDGAIVFVGERGVKRINSP